MPALDVRDLVLRYPRAQAPAVDGLTLQAQAGSITALLGPNGAGKTSTIECCVGLRRPTGGSLTVLGVPAQRLRDPAHRAQVGIMLQDGGLPTGAKPIPLLRHLASLYQNPVDVDALIDRLGIASFAGTGIRRLSGGQKQRVAMAAALVGRPRLVFLDEPTAGLDPAAAATVNELTRELAAAGVAVILTTHDMTDAEELADHVYIVDHGQVVASGTVAELTRAGTSSIRLTTPAPLDTASLRLPRGCRIDTDRPGHYRVSGFTGPEALVAVARWLDAQGVLPHELTQRERTLEDVFLDVTGRELR